MLRRPPRSTRNDKLLPYTTLFRAGGRLVLGVDGHRRRALGGVGRAEHPDVVALAQPVQQRCRQSHLLAAHEVVHAMPTLGWPNRVLEMAGVQRVEVIGDAGRGGDLRVVGTSSEERRVGKECGSTCRSRWWPYPYKKQT